MAVSLAGCPAHQLLRSPHPCILLVYLCEYYSTFGPPTWLCTSFPVSSYSPVPGRLPGYALLLPLSKHLPRCSVWQKCGIGKVILFLSDTWPVLAVTYTNCGNGSAEPEQGAGLGFAPTTAASMSGWLPLCSNDWLGTRVEHET